MQVRLLCKLSFTKAIWGFKYQSLITNRCGKMKSVCTALQSSITWLVEFKEIIQIFLPLLTAVQAG